MRNETFNNHSLDKIIRFLHQRCMRLEVLASTRFDPVGKVGKLSVQDLVDFQALLSTYLILLLQDMF